MLKSHFSQDLEGAERRLAKLRTMKKNMHFFAVHAIM